jgi:hypothetical protein
LRKGRSAAHSQDKKPITDAIDAHLTDEQLEDDNGDVGVLWMLSAES